MIYVAGLIGIYYGLAIRWLTQYRGKSVLLGFLSILGFIAVLRGDVGTDTLNYQMMVLEFQRSRVFPLVEPGFALLVATASLLFSSEVVGTRFISAVFLCVLYLFAVKADRDESLVLFGYFVPAFFFQYSMNGLRIGLASALFLLAVLYWRRNCRVTFVCLTIAALGFHYSIALGLIAMFILDRQWSDSIGILGVVGLFAVLTSLVYFNSGYILEKMALYAQFQSPGPFSGLSKFVPICVVLCGVIASRVPFVERSRVVVLFGVLGAGFWALAAVTYAGLRLLDVLAFMLPVLLLVRFRRVGMSFDPPVRVAIVLGGLFGAFGSVYGFFGSASVGDAPFIPYSVFF